jgi:hypothetical protein
MPNLITFVVETPSAEDSSYSAAVWQVVDQVGIPRDSVRFVPLVPVRDTEGPLSVEEVAKNIQSLWADLRVFKPKLVVAMGAVVAKYLTGSSALKNARSRTTVFRVPAKCGSVPEDLITLPVTATVSPGAVFHQLLTGTGTGRNDLVSDLDTIWLNARGLTRDPRCDYKWMVTIEEIDNYLSTVERLFAAGEIPGCIVDVETNQHLDPYKETSQLVAIGFSHRSWFARAIKIHHKDAVLWSTPGAWEWLIDRLNQFFRKVRTGGWNYKFDVRWIRKHLGVREFAKPFFDGQLAHAAIFTEPPHDLKNVSIKLTGSSIQEGPKDHAIAELRRVYPDNPERWHMGHIDQDILLTYLGGDVDKSYQNWEILNPMLDNDACYRPTEFQKKHPGFSHRHCYENRLLEAIVPFSEIEDNGLAVNKRMLEWMLREYPSRLETKVLALCALPVVAKVVSDVRREVEETTLQAEAERVARRNNTELEKAATKEGYIPKSFVARSVEELKPKYKDDRTIVTYHEHISRILYEELGVPFAVLGIKVKFVTKKNGKVRVNGGTDAQAITKITEWAVLNGRPDVADVCKQIAALKKDEKNYNAYVKSMPEYIKFDGRVRTTYNISGARTGRCSTSDPNFHGMPTRNTDDSLAIIKMFESRWVREGGLILARDYAAMELRIIAAQAQEESLLEAFRSGADPHRAAAARIFDKDPEAITDEERKAAKTINFGVLYGMSPIGLAVALGIKEDKAKEFIELFFERMPAIKEWIKKQETDMLSRVVIRDGTGRMADNPRFNPNRRISKNNPRKRLVDFVFDQYGYITTTLGRKRIMPGAGHWEYGLASKAKRQAGNTPIQSIASDIAMDATVRIHNRLKKEGLRSKVFGFIHDSIKTDIFPGEFEAVDFIKKEEMENTPAWLYRDWLNVPIVTSGEVGTGWGYHVEIMKSDFTNNVYEFEGDDLNIGLVERALSCSHEIELLDTKDVLKKGVVVGVNKTIRMTPRARSAAA